MPPSEEDCPHLSPLPRDCPQLGPLAGIPANERLASLQGIRALEALGPFPSPDAALRKRLSPSHCDCHKLLGVNPQGLGKLDEQREGRSRVEEPCVQSRSLPKLCGERELDAALRRRLSPSESASKRLSPTRSARRHSCRMSAWHPFKGFGALEASGPTPSPDAARRRRLSPFLPSDRLCPHPAST